MSYVIVGEGMTLHGKYVYREILRPERLAFIASFTDSHGKTCRASFSDLWPLEILVVITLESVGSSTKVTLEATPIDASEAELRAFHEEREGLNQTLVQLEAYLLQKGT